MRGGYRPGAGRKKQDTVAVSLRIKRTSKQLLDEESERTGKRQGAILDEIIEKTLKKGDR